MNIQFLEKIFNNYKIKYETLEKSQYKVFDKLIDVIVFTDGKTVLLTDVETDGTIKPAEYMNSNSDYTFLIGTYSEMNTIISLPTKIIQNHLKNQSYIHQEQIDNMTVYYKQLIISDIIMSVYDLEQEDDFVGYLSFTEEPFEIKIIKGFKFLKEVDNMRGNGEKMELVQAQPKRDLASLPQEKIELLKRTVAKGVTDDEFQIFLALAQKYDLDPFARQIWCVKYDKNEPAAIFTGRDGFLHLAHMTGQFDGMETTVRKENEPLVIKDKYGRVKINSDFQYVATCTVYRKDMNHPITVEVWEEEYNTGNKFWTTKRRTMIQKVAESQALRRAFDISGLYAPEEFGYAEAQSEDDEQNNAMTDVKVNQVDKTQETLEKLSKVIKVQNPLAEDTEDVEAKVLEYDDVDELLEEEAEKEENDLLNDSETFGDRVVKSNLATEPQIKKLHAVLHQITKLTGKNKDKIIENIKKKHNVEHLHEISKADMSKLIDYFENKLNELGGGK